MINRRDTFLKLRFLSYDLECVVTAGYDQRSPSPVSSGPEQVTSLAKQEPKRTFSRVIYSLLVTFHVNCARVRARACEHHVQDHLEHAAPSITVSTIGSIRNVNILQKAAAGGNLHFHISIFASTLAR